MVTAAAAISTSAAGIVADGPAIICTCAAAVGIGGTTIAVAMEWPGIARTLAVAFGTTLGTAVAAGTSTGTCVVAASSNTTIILL